MHQGKNVRTQPFYSIASRIRDLIPLADQVPTGQKIESDRISKFSRQQYNYPLLLRKIQTRAPDNYMLYP